MNKLTKLFLIVFSLVIIISSVYFFSYQYFSNDELVQKNIKNSLKELSDSYEDLVIQYFDERKDDSEFLASNNIIRNSLNGKLKTERGVAKKNLYEQSRIISKEIQNYLLKNNDLNVKQLQSDYEFQKIAVQKIANDGYSLIYNLENGEILFHPDSFFIGKSATYFKEAGPKYYESISEIQRTKEYQESNYFLKESDGNIREKFATHDIIPIVLGDGIKLVLSSTTYVKDYFVLENVSLETKQILHSYTQDLDYTNSFLISPEGYVVYENNKEREGLRLNYFNDIKEKLIDNKSFIYGPYRQNQKIVFSTISSVYDDDKFLGAIVLEFSSDALYKQLESNEGTFVYLLNEKQLLISPFNGDASSILIQSVDTKNSQNCFSKKYLTKSTERISEFLDYKGELVLGDNRYLSSIDYCLLVEFDKEIKLDNNRIKRSLEMLRGVFVLILISFMVLFVLVKLLNKKYKIKRTKCKISIHNSYLEKQPERKVFFYSFIFTLLVYISLLFIFNISNFKFNFEKYFFIFLFIFLSFFMAIISLKIKKDKSKNIIFFGSVILFFVYILKLVFYLEIFNEFFFSMVSNIFYLEYLSFIFIFEGYRRLFS